MTVDLSVDSATAWQGFAPGPWQTGIDVPDFVARNHVPWTAGLGADQPAAARAAALVRQAEAGVADWVCELSPGLPLVSWQAVGRPLDLGAGFDAAAPQRVRAALAAHLFSGFPGSAGRMLGDYRRIALYGVDRLIEDRRRERDLLDTEPSTEGVVARRLAVAAEIEALRELVEVGRRCGADLGAPARTAREAAQWVMLGYLTALAGGGDAQTAWGRVTPFWDVYVRRDLASGALAEREAQELVDEVVLGLGLVRQLRPTSPVVVTLGGLADDGRPLVSATCLRLIRAFGRVGRARVPDLAVLWSADLPGPFRRAVAATSLAGRRVTYVCDELVRESGGSDAAILGDSAAAVTIGRQVVLDGLRVNLAKALLYAVNAGRDELTGRQVGPVSAAVSGAVLDADELTERYAETLRWVAAAAVDALTVGHLLADRRPGPCLARALADRTLVRTLVCDVLGLPTVADSLAAVRYAAVLAERSTDGLAIGFRVSGAAPRFGGGAPQVDELAGWVLRTFVSVLREQHPYRAAGHVQGLVAALPEDGEHTGATPDGRPAQALLVPRPRDVAGLVASAATLPWTEVQAGSVCPVRVPAAELGDSPEARVAGLLALVDGSVVARGAYGLRVRVTGTTVPR